VDGRLSDRTRATAAALVIETAQALWEGRRTVGTGEPLARHGAHLVFPVFPETPASGSYPAGAAVELSTQLQAWMILEAAAAVWAIQN
jgi:predicted alpha-1,6-mannanase (GH76 family)